jgi:hypothetical protein
MAGECIESGQNGGNGHFGEYSNSTNWRIFGEYSNSTNSPASGHCLILSQYYFLFPIVKNSTLSSSLTKLLDFLTDKGTLDRLVSFSFKAKIILGLLNT